MDAASLSSEVISARSAPRISLIRDRFARVAGALARPFADPRIFPGRVSRLPARGWSISARLQLAPRADHSDLHCGDSHAAYFMAMESAEIALAAQRDHNRPRDRPAAARRQSLRASDRRRRGYRGEIDLPRARKASVQPRDTGRDRRDRRTARYLGICRPMGTGGRVRRMVSRLGAIVTRRAERGDISWGFLAMYLSAIAARDAWFGYRFAVWTHQLDSGALLLFAFFMISDPMTSPNSRRGRIAHAAVVCRDRTGASIRSLRAELAHLGAVLRFIRGARVGPLLPAPKFEWNSSGGSHESENGRAHHHRALDHRRRRDRAAA